MTTTTNATKRLRGLVLATLPPSSVHREPGGCIVLRSICMASGHLIETWDDLDGLTDVELISLLPPDTRTSEFARLEAYGDEAAS